jgi:hypothetical protein
MNRLRLCPFVLLPLVLTGCFVQSLYPCYTEENKIDLPGVVGDWRGADDEEGTNPLWRFLEDGTVVTQEDGVASKLVAVYFQVGEHRFVDWTPAGLDEQDCVNLYWLTHVMPTHSVLKVELDGDALTLTALDMKWTAEALKEVPAPLASLPAAEEDRPLIVASPAEWEVFLRRHAGNPEAFNPDAALRLVRVRPSGA